MSQGCNDYRDTNDNWQLSSPWTRVTIVSRWLQNVIIIAVASEFKARFSTNRLIINLKLRLYISCIHMQ